MNVVILWFSLSMCEYVCLVDVFHWSVALCCVRVAERSKAPDSRVTDLLGVLVHECGRGFESHL